MRGPAAGSKRAASRRATFLVLATVVAGYGLMQTLVIPVLPAIQAGLHTTQDTATWLITVYLLTASVATPIMGRLGDMFGKPRMLIAAVGALALGSLLAGLADHVSVMLAGRALQGVGGGVLPLAFGMIRDIFPEERVAGTVGAMAALAAAGSGLGIVVGGPIVEALNYHWLFWIPMIVLTLGGITARWVLPPSSPATGRGRVNWTAATLLSGWLLALLLGISEAPGWGWGSPRVVGLLAGATVLFVAWVLVEEHSAHPLIDMRLMRTRPVWSTNVVAILLGASLYAPFAFLPAFMQTHPSAGYGFGVSVTVSGLIMSPTGIFAFALGMSAGRLARRHGGRAVLVVGLLCCAVSFVLLSSALAAIWEIVVAMVFAGIGNGLAFASLSALVVQGVPLDQTGVASGMNANIRTIGGAIGAAAMTSIVSAGVRAGGLPPRSGYVYGFAAMAVCCVASAVVCLAVPRVKAGATIDTSMLHAELGLVAGGTLVGDEPE